MEQPTPTGWISEIDFTQAVNALPLVSVDLVVVNAANEVLLGKRLNRPAQGWWFTPGARVRKNEMLQAALQRVWQQELGQRPPMPEVQLLGAWDHLYSDSAFDANVSTHYVNLPHLLRLASQTSGSNAWDGGLLPSDQHGQWVWMPLAQAATDTHVHTYVRPYASAVLQRLEGSRE